MKNFPWKQVLTAGALIVAVILTIPTFNPQWWPHKTINLGLDLQGGMHLILEVETEKAVEARIAGIAREIQDAVREKRIRHATIKASGQKIITTIRGASNIEAFNTLLDEDFDDLRLLTESGDTNTQERALNLPDKQAEDIKTMATEQALETIRNRVDEFGVSEPSIRVQGKRRILIQLPGVTDPSRAKNLIGKTALLEFRMVDEEHDVDKALSGDVPPGSEILYQIKTDTSTNRTIKVPFLVKKDTPLPGADLADARVRIDAG